MLYPGCGDHVCAIGVTEEANTKRRQPFQSWLQDVAGATDVDGLGFGVGYRAAERPREVDHVSQPSIPRRTTRRHEYRLRQPCALGRAGGSWRAKTTTSWPARVSHLVVAMPKAPVPPVTRTRPLELTRSPRQNVAGEAFRCAPPVISPRFRRTTEPCSRGSGHRMFPAS